MHSLYSFLISLGLMTVVSFADLPQTDKQLFQNNGVNLLENPGFENSISGWTKSATGTFAIVTGAANAIQGNASLQFTASASGQYIESALKTFPAGRAGGPCLSQIRYSTTETTNLYKIRVLDGSNNDVYIDPSTGVAPLLPTTNGLTESSFLYPVAFVCPVASTTYKVRIESTGSAAAIKLDDAHLGTDIRLGKFSQARYFGSGRYAATANCLFSRTDAAYGPFPADTDCPTMVTTGGVTASSTKIPGFDIASLPPAKLKITTNGSFLKNTAAAYTCSFRMHDGTTATDQEPSSYSGGDNASQGTHVYYFDYPSGFDSLKTFQIQNKGDGSNACLIATNGVEGQSLTFDVEVLPYGSEVVTSVAALNWRVDANITGSGNIALPASDQTSFVEITDSDLTLTNSSKATINCQIACANGNASSGSTCSSSDESVGIACNFPRAGKIKGCVTLNRFINDTSEKFALRLDQTTNTSSATTTAGNEIQTTGADATPGAHDLATALDPCGVFDVVQGQNTFRAKYMQDITGSGGEVVVDTLVGLSGFSVHFEAWPIDYVEQAFARIGNAVITESNDTNGLESISFGGSTEPSLCNSSPCTIYRSSSSWVSSVTYTATGIYTLNINPGVFSSEPVCTVTTRVANACVEETDTGSATSKVFRARTCSTAVATDTGMNVVCMGPKN